MAEIINAISGLFSTLHNAWIKSPSAFIIVILVCISVYLAVENNKILKHDPDNPAIEQERFKRVVQLNEEIPNKLESLRQELDTDRILVRQFHNGKRGITGIPFMFVQTTYAVSEPGQGLTDQEAWLSYPISTMSRTLNLMFDKNGDPRCVHLDTDDVPDDMYRAYLNRYKVQYFIKCPLLDNDNRVVGFIGTGWTGEQLELKKDKNTELDFTIYEGKLNKVGRDVVRKLDTIDKPKSEAPWWQFWK